MTAFQQVEPVPVVQEVLYPPQLCRCITHRLTRVAPRHPPRAPDKVHKVISILDLPEFVMTVRYCEY